MLATEQLKQDHQEIMRFLAVLEYIGKQIKEGKVFPAELYFRFIDFMYDFINKCHHSKEEKYYFPIVENHGIATRGFIEKLLEDHEHGRHYIPNFEETAHRIESGDRAAADLIPQIANNYVTLFRPHTLKEDNVLFKAAEQTLSSREKEKLHDQFEEIEEKQLGSGRHQEFLDMLDGWEHDFGLTHHFVH